MILYSPYNADSILLDMRQDKENKTLPLCAGRKLPKHSQMIFYLSPSSRYKKFISRRGPRFNTLGSLPGPVDSQKYQETPRNGFLLLSCFVIIIYHEHLLSDR